MSHFTDVPDDNVVVTRLASRARVATEQKAEGDVQGALDTATLANSWSIRKFAGVNGDRGLTHSEIINHVTAPTSVC